MTFEETLELLRSYGLTPRYGEKAYACRITKRLVRRFLKYVKVRSKDKCWLWLGKGQDSGYGKYGRFGIKASNKNGIRGRQKMAHRVSYLIFKKYIPDTKVIRHKKCDNPPCVNPFHLCAGTQKQNVQDSIKKGRCIRAKGSKHGRAKLTEDIVIKIRKYYETGEYTRLSLARFYNVAPSLIAFITNREIWKHV